MGLFKVKDPLLLNVQLFNTFIMRTKYRVTFYRLGRKNRYVICTRSYASTRKFAWKHMFKDRVYWFKIDEHIKRRKEDLELW